MSSDAIAKLILEDGSVFLGKSFGYGKSTAGEVVFTTGMVGYPEALTDPSYSGQILVFTYPLIGNYGVPPNVLHEKIEKYFESGKVQTKGLVVSECSSHHNHWISDDSLRTWLLKNQIPGIYDVDTRSIVRKIREHGTMLGKIVIDEDVDFYNPNKDDSLYALRRKKCEEFGNGAHKLLLIDCGMKNNLLRELISRNMNVKVVPYNHDIIDEEFDGMVISNGPGDPVKYPETVSLIKNALRRDKPILGICLGHQLLALAAGARTYKLKFGHRGHNQPCRDYDSKCFITSQNHGFAVDSSTIPDDWKETYHNINDNTNEGIAHLTKPYFSVQFHPEGCCGPQDTNFIFDQFTKLVTEKWKK